jgi:hypothetical protein
VVSVGRSSNSVTNESAHSVPYSRCVATSPSKLETSPFRLTLIDTEQGLLSRHRSPMISRLTNSELSFGTGDVIGGKVVFSAGEFIRVPSAVPSEVPVAGTTGALWKHPAIDIPDASTSPSTRHTMNGAAANRRATRSRSCCCGHLWITLN